MLRIKSNDELQRGCGQCPDLGVVVNNADGDEMFDESFAILDVAGA